MTPPYTKRRKPVSTDATYRVYNRHELDSGARTAYTYTAGTMMIVATTGSTIIFILSVAALQGIYGWYPQFVAQQWFIYDQLFTTFSFLGLASGALATTLILSRRSHRAAAASATACTLSGTSVLIISTPSSTVAISTLLLPTAIHSTINRNSPNHLTGRRDGTQLTIEPQKNHGLSTQTQSARAPISRM